jgi:uncharacterized cysteine cluster protein YcgN (CxxCxxCC family)
MTSKKPRAAAPDAPFWRTKTLAEMTQVEWESLCDGCGRCCLNKLEEEDTGRIYYTSVGCRLFDEASCRCRDYDNRQAFVEDCLQLTPENVPETPWLPPTCGYRLIADGKNLAWWHPLVSGSRDTVHQAGISVRGRAVSERRAGPLEHHIVDWPGQTPRPKRNLPETPPKETKS